MRKALFALLLSTMSVAPVLSNFANAGTQVTRIVPVEKVITKTLMRVGGCSLNSHGSGFCYYDYTLEFCIEKQTWLEKQTFDASFFGGETIVSSEIVPDSIQTRTGRSVETQKTEDMWSDCRKACDDRTTALQRVANPDYRCSN